MCEACICPNMQDGRQNYVYSAIIKTLIKLPPVEIEGRLMGLRLCVGDKKIDTYTCFAVKGMFVQDSRWLMYLVLNYILIATGHILFTSGINKRAPL